MYAVASARIASARAAVTAARVGSQPRWSASQRRIASAKTVESVKPSATGHSSSSICDDDRNDSPRNIIRVSNPDESRARRSSSR